MRDADGQRLPLKATLLVGVAGVATMTVAAAAADPASPSSAAPATPSSPAVSAPSASAATPIPPPKWLPSVDIGGGVGSGFAVGRAEAFVPVWQDLDSLLFVRFGADTRTHYDGNFNLGLGYRTKVDSDWLIGMFAGVDSSHTELGSTFKQYSLGAEAMSADWDIRANAYFADRSNKPITDKYELYIKDTSIAILQAQEAALSGFDGEIGYRIFSTDSTDVRVFAGAYSFHHDDVNIAGIGTAFRFPYKDISGPKFRAEVNVFDLDALGAQSRLSLEGEISHDSVNHTSEFVGATLRIALDDTSGQGAQALDELDRRMADPMRRRDDVLTEHGYSKPEPVIIYNGTITSQQTNTLYYVEQRSGTGSGSYADPTTLQDATSRGPKNQFIVLTDRGGSNIDAGGTVVQTGETVTGGGTFHVRGVQSNQVFTHDFAPGSGPVSISSKTDPVITLQSKTALSDVTITGPFHTAIYGFNVSDVQIADVTIDGGGAGYDGIILKQSDLSGIADIDIEHVSITGLTHDGIDLTVSGTSAASSTTNLQIGKSTIHVAHDGVAITSSASGAADLTVYMGIHDSSIIAGGTAAGMTGTSAPGAVLAQTLVVDPTVLSGGQYGVHVKAVADGGALTQNIGISDVTISDVSKGGVVISASADQAATLDQSIDITNLTIGDTDTPFRISAKADHDATLQQNLTAADLILGVGQYDELGFYASARHGASLTQNAVLSRVTADNAPGNALYMYTQVRSGATAIQNVAVSGLAANNSGRDGAWENLSVGGSGSVGAQYLSLSDAHFENSGQDGIYASAIADDHGVARQDIYAYGVNVSHAGDDGIKVYSAALNGASMQQDAYLYDVNATHSGSDGISITNYAQGGLAFAAQSGAIYDVDVSHAGRDGLYFGSVAKAADTEQQFYAYFVTADHEGYNGIGISAVADGYAVGSYQSYAAHVEQDLSIIYGDVSHNANDGVMISNNVSNSAALDQTIFLYGLQIDSNGRHGVEQESILYQSQGSSYPAYVAQAHLYSSLYVDASTVEHNAGDGIHIYSLDVGTPGMQVYANVQDSTVSHNGNDGIYDALIEAATYGVYVLNNGLGVSGSVVDHNGANGIDIQTAAYGPTVLIFNLGVDSSDVSHNTGAGIVDYAYAAGYDSLNLHYVTLNNSTFDHNGGDGVDMIAVQNYGYGPRGVAGQIAYVTDSDFSYNGGDGFFANALSLGPNGRTEQYIYISGSRFDHNAYDGLDLRRTTLGGAYYAGYDCSLPQYSYGGCAFVRQVVSITGSDFSYNTGNGIELDTELLGYGSAYSSAGHPTGLPTLYIGDSTINHNGGDGIHIYNDIEYGSAEYQSIYISGTQIAHNGGDGIHIYNYNYGGSQIQALVLANGSDVSHNAGNGISLYTVSYYAATQVNGLGVYDSSVSHNGIAGVNLYSYVVGAYLSSQVFHASGSKFDDNTYFGAALGNVSYASNYAYQVVNTQANEFEGNGLAGMFALMTAGGDYVAGQYVYSTGDTFSANVEYGLNVTMLAGAQYATQKIALTDVAATGNYLGVAIAGAAALDPLAQQITVDGGTFDKNTFAGLYIQTSARSGGAVYSTVYVKNAEFSHNNAGLLLGNYADTGSLVSQTAYVYADSGKTLSFSANADIGLGQASHGYGTTETALYVENGKFTSNGNYGVFLSTSSYGAGNTANFAIEGNTFHDNGTGVYLYAYNSNQYAFIQHNNFVTNAVGIGAYATVFGYQYLNVHTNTHNSDGAKYSFGYDISSAQHVVY